jgi:hypothetical protein
MHDCMSKLNVYYLLSHLAHLSPSTCDHSGGIWAHSTVQTHSAGRYHPCIWAPRTPTPLCHMVSLYWWQPAAGMAYRHAHKHQIPSETRSHLNKDHAITVFMKTNSLWIQIPFHYRSNPVSSWFWYTLHLNNVPEFSWKLTWMSCYITNGLNKNFRWKKYTTLFQNVLQRQEDGR